MRPPSTILPALVSAAGLIVSTALATDPITLTIDATQTGYAIPSNYVGLSFSRDSISGSHSYEQLFDPNKDAYYPHLTNLLAQIGVRHLRTISGTASATDPDPSSAQDDKFFAFAKASGVTSVIYSLHLFNETGNDNLLAAYHIWTTPADKALLESFALDNESDWKYHYRSPYPDLVITGYATPAGYGYKDKWALLYANIQGYLGNPSPAAPFSGPDTGSNYPIQTDSSSDTSIPNPGGVPFTLRFAIDQASRLKTATQHYYYGTPGTSLVQIATIDLSPTRLAEWNTLYANSLAGASGWPSGLPYRLTESSPFNNGGGNPGGQVFATALWGLDYSCWWAMHGCAGINPFTRVVQDALSPSYFLQAYGTDHNLWCSISAMFCRHTPNFKAKDFWVWPPAAYILRILSAFDCVNFACGFRSFASCLFLHTMSIELSPRVPRKRWDGFTQCLTSQ